MKGRWGLSCCAVLTALVSGCAAPLFEGTAFEQSPARASSASAQSGGADLRQLSDQVGALSRSLEVLDGRVSKLEAQAGAPAVTSDEVTALRRDIQQLRTERDSLKREVTDDLAARVEKIAARQQPSEARAGRAASAVAPAAATPAAARSPNAAGGKRGGYEHKVEKGQTLSEIAKGYNTTVDAIIKANKITNPSAIRVGQVLFIPD